MSAYIQAIMDLWDARCFAFALVDSKSELWAPSSPRELYDVIEVAYMREFEPLVVQRLSPEKVSDEVWRQFLSEFPIRIYAYENGQVVDQSGRGLMIDDGTTFYQWRRQIDENEQLKSVRETIRYGSGSLLMEPIPLRPLAKHRRAGARIDLVHH